MKPFKGKAVQDETGLWVARQAEIWAQDMKARISRPGMLQRVNEVKTVYDQHGKPICQVKISDFGNTEHVYDDHQDAVVRPNTVKLRPSAPPTGS